MIVSSVSTSSYKHAATGPEPARRWIWTVNGPVDPQEIGITLVHEHLLSDGSCYFRPTSTADAEEFAHEALSEGMIERVRANSVANYDNLRLDDADLVATEIAEFRDMGGQTIVDVSSIGLGRDPLGLRLLSERTGVRVVMGCGFYCEYSHPDRVRQATVADLAAAMVHEVLDGVDGVRAGVIGEIGINGQERGTWRLVGEMTADEEKVLRAAIRASDETGAAVIIHQPNRSSAVPEILRILREEHATPHRVILGHMSSIPDFYMHLLALDNGYWIAYDNFGMGHLRNAWFHPINDRQRIDWLRKLFAKGYSDQLLISHDVWCKAQYRRYGGQGYGHILRSVVPQLLDHGLSKSDMSRLLVDNPARALAF